MKRWICGVQWECVEPGHWRSPMLPESVHVWRMMAGTAAQQWEAWLMDGDKHIQLLACSFGNNDLEGCVRNLLINGVSSLVSEGELVRAFEKFIDKAEAGGIDPDWDGPFGKPEIMEARVALRKHIGGAV